MNAPTGGSYAELANKRIAWLQDRYLKDTITRKDLAILARSITKPVGSDPQAAKWSLDGLPIRRGGAYTSTSMEKASWNTFALYAIHQRGEHHKRMHRPGITMGSALERLDRNQSATRPRNLTMDMRRLAGIHNQDEAIPILARLMRLMQDDGIGVDHIRLAWDLRDLDDQRRRPRVLANWFRRTTRD